MVQFNIPGTGVRTIAVGSGVTATALPALTQPVVVDGYTQSGASPNTLANGGDAKILIELNGTAAGATASGIELAEGSGGSTIRGLVVNRFAGNGVLVDSDGNTIAGNYVGLDATGTTAQPNQVDGIVVRGASNNTIGGTTPAARNVSSGNGLDGIHVVGDLTSAASGNLIQGNFVGVNAAGTGSVGVRPGGPLVGTTAGNFLFGIEISGGTGNTVGGTTAGARNVVGFNGAGIEVDNGGQNNVIQGNFSGVGADGTKPVGNVLHGIVLRSNANLAAPLGPGQANEPAVANNLVGGTAAGAGNTVAFNGTGGVAVFGNPIALSNQPNVGNAILGNSIYRNGRSNPTTLLGIDLTNGFAFPTDDGATANDAKGHGTPADPNNFQNAPVLTALTAGGTTLTGTLTQSISPSTAFRVEVFASDADPAGAAAEGQTFLGFATATTDATGAATFTFTLPATAAGRTITATATDPANNTSEFSNALIVPARGTEVLVGSKQFAVGSDSGGSSVSVLNADGSQAFAIAAPFGAGFTGGSRVATADFNGDGVPDVAIGTGPGAATQVIVVDGKTQAQLFSVQPFEAAFTGGVFVAAGDVTGDGKADLVVTPDEGGGPRVDVFTGNGFTRIASFFGIDDTNFRGGARAAVGDVNGDGVGDVVVAAGFGGGPRVAGFDGKSLTGTPTKVFADFFAFEQTLRNGVFIAVGDVNGDGVADIIAGGGPGGGPRVTVFSAAGLTAAVAPTTVLANFFAGDVNNRGGIRVTARNLDNDANADLVVGSGTGAGSHVTVYLGKSVQATGVPAAALDLDAIAGFTGGVFVG
ncbi:beta strand repeat-containing protein [Limnoglobus roseus]|uniref:beta strand repeat-containing protein n=1 Tax=Limnoglobus roseus TaxID=2598579 RepID=UPI0011EADC86|nr:VCBS repeat-containing protein [Limnoglobus roseus]